LPWLYLQTGDASGDLLREAYNVEATVGGTVAMYAALFADHGYYGDRYWYNETVRAQLWPGGEVPVRLADGSVQPSAPPAPGAPAGDDRETPAVGPAFLAVALLAALLRRR
jgi:hypothetical protein